MAIIVQKFGGAALANLDYIKNAAQLIKHEVSRGHKIIAVVSAMAGATDKLISQANELSNLNCNAKLAEYDAAISSAEQVSAGFMAMALLNLDIKARSWQGWQIGLKTDSKYADANIININTAILKEALNNDDVAIVSGFQGIDDFNRITTLGRGGSDYTAIALACGIGALRCDFYKDVAGIFDADPKIVNKARHIKHINYSYMHQMASLGAKALQAKSIMLAAKHHMVLKIRSLTQAQQWTIVNDLEELTYKPIIAISSKKILLCYSENQISNITLNDESLMPLNNNSFALDDIDSKKQEIARHELIIDREHAQIGILLNNNHTQDAFRQKLVDIIDNKSIDFLHLIHQANTIILIVKRLNVQKIIEAIYSAMTDINGHHQSSEYMSAKL